MVFIASFMKMFILPQHLLQGLKNFQTWRLIKHVISLRNKENFATKLSHQEQTLRGYSSANMSVICFNVSNAFSVNYKFYCDKPTGSPTSC